MSMVAAKPAAVPRPVHRSRLKRLMTSTIGQKIVMAVTGVLLSLFVLGHMVGNLQVFQGAEAINDYAKLLRKEPALLWLVRFTLLAAVGLHFWAFIALTRTNLGARATGYRVASHKESSYASRSMRITGPLVLAFIVYHILHMTTGTVHPTFKEGEVYHNLSSAFSIWWVVLIYVLGLAMLALHLWHGVWSLFQTLGVSQARYGSLGRRVATVFTLVVTLGFVAVPLAGLAGILK
jgi:succinate dehydrogenase / fumarate reductase, cytochrome b subunit